MTPLEATPGNVVLKVLEKKAYSGSIALPDSAKEDSDWCEIVSIGYTDDNTYFTVGDIVLRPDPAEVEYEDDDTGEKFLIVPDTSIVAWKNA
jgi:co-chaperonin GroES (HSP10)